MMMIMKMIMVMLMVLMILMMMLMMLLMLMLIVLLIMIITMTSLNLIPEGTGQRRESKEKWYWGTKQQNLKNKRK